MKKKNIKIVLISIFFLGLFALLYPAISQYWNSFASSKVIRDYDNFFANIEDKDYSDEFNKADKYNQDLFKLSYPLAQYKELSGYTNIINVNNTGMMGYISITKIKVEIPIYHGTSASVLNTAVGHLEGSSLPVGGKSTHSVLSAHRGLPSAKLFTDLNKLELGDIFEITILDRKLTYQVDNIVIVNPKDIEKLEIIEGEDYITLLTCTPYGLNTHRLLVRGKRIENIDNKKIYVTSEAFKISNLLVAPLVALPIIITLLLIITFKPVKSKNNNLEEYLKKKKEKSVEVKK